MKPLLPTLREKKRYIAYEVQSKTGLNTVAAGNAIKEAFVRLFGVVGASKAGIIMTNKRTKNRGVIRVSHAYVDNVKAAMISITKINNHPVALKSVAVSGMMNKAAIYLR